EFPDLDEVPAFAMGQRLLGGAVDRMAAINHLPVEIDPAAARQVAGSLATQPEVKGVNSLPHLAGDVFAYGASILPRRGDARPDRARVLLGESHEGADAICVD